jgi:hypothetical protein
MTPVTLGGPYGFSRGDVIARIARLRPVLVRMPFALWGALAGLAERLPQRHRNQVELMQIDTTASESLPGLRSLGISPRSLEDELGATLGRTIFGPPEEFLLDLNRDLLQPSLQPALPSPAGEAGASEHELAQFARERIDVHVPANQFRKYALNRSSDPRTT